MSSNRDNVMLIIFGYDEIDNLALDPTTFDLYIKVNRMLSMNSITVLRKILTNTIKGRDNERSGTYEKFLQTAMATGTVSDLEHKFVEDMKKTYGYDENHHEEHLKRINMSSKQYNQMLASKELQSLNAYKNKLGVMLAMGSLSASDMKTIASTRQELCITAAQHTSTLKELNLTEASFQALAKQVQECKLAMYTRLLGAFLGDKQAGAGEMTNVQAYRKRNAISDTDHLVALKRAGKTDADFARQCTSAKRKDSGQKGTESLYSRLLQGFISAGVVTQTDMKELKRLAPHLSISDVVHKRLLGTLGMSPLKFSALVPVKEALRSSQATRKKEQKQVSTSSKQVDFEERNKRELLFLKQHKKQEAMAERKIRKLMKKQADGERDRVNQSYTLETLKFKISKLQATCDRQTIEIEKLHNLNDEKDKKLQVHHHGSAAMLTEMQDAKKWAEIHERERDGARQKIELLEAQLNKQDHQIRSDLERVYKKKMNQLENDVMKTSEEVQEFQDGKSALHKEWTESKAQAAKAVKDVQTLSTALEETKNTLKETSESLRTMEHHSNFLEQKLVLTKEAHQKLLDEAVDLKSNVKEWEEYAMTIKSQLTSQTSLVSGIVKEKLRFKKIVTLLCCHFFVKSYKSGKVLKKMLLLACDWNHELSHLGDMTDSRNLHRDPEFQLAYQKKRNLILKANVPRTHGLADILGKFDVEFHQMLDHFRHLKRKIAHWHSTSKVFFERNLELVNVKNDVKEQLSRSQVENQNLRSAVDKASHMIKNAKFAYRAGLAVPREYGLHSSQLSGSGKAFRKEMFVDSSPGTVTSSMTQSSLKPVNSHKRPFAPSARVPGGQTHSRASTINNKNKFSIVPGPKSARSSVYSKGSRRPSIGSTNKGYHGLSLDVNASVVRGRPSTSGSSTSGLNATSPSTPFLSRKKLNSFLNTHRSPLITAHTASQEGSKRNIFFPEMPPTPRAAPLTTGSQVFVIKK
jgi:hypothetical protein